MPMRVQLSLWAHRGKRHKNAVSFLRPEISGVREESALLLGQYPNCFRTCSRGLMSASLTLFSRLSPSPPVPMARAPPFCPRGREIVGSIEFSTVLDDDAESSLAFPPSPRARIERGELSDSWYLSHFRGSSRSLDSLIFALLFCQCPFHSRKMKMT